MKIMFAALGLGGWEMVLILAVVLLLFGARKLPDLAKGLGQGIKEFKKASKDEPEKLPSSSENSHKQA
ncbi:MAG: twin-arginine translocation protein TatA/E family subunit [Verrucomicrobiales bacterium]|nr:twin-arginine translocation protein TatA/E family subunit [Verrucomicrobiales bacterium]